MLKVYTSNIKYSGKDRLDITVKSGDKVFAPTWDLVRNIKSGKITELQYKRYYEVLMEHSYITHKEHWKQLLNMKKVVLLCYCPANTFCHRLLLARILEKYGAKYYGEI